MITNANSSYNPDLYRALKGASNNLGIITRVQLPLVPAGQIWGGTYSLPYYRRQDITSYFEKFDNSATYDPYASLMYTAIYLNRTWANTLFLAYTKPDTINPKVFAPLFEMKPIGSSLRSTTHSNLTDELEIGGLSIRRSMVATFTHRNSAVFMDEWFKIFEAETPSMVDRIPSLVFTNNLQPWPRIITRQASKNGGNILGLDDDDDLTNVNLTVFWDDVEDDDVVNEMIQDLLGKGEKLAKDMGVWNRFVYLNYAEKWQNPLRGYGDRGLDLLKEASNKYDTEKTFQLAVKGGFKMDAA